MKDVTIKTTHETTVTVELDEDEMNALVLPALLRKANAAMSKASKPPLLDEGNFVRVTRYERSKSTHSIIGDAFFVTSILVMKHE